jgi:proline iminopeptidase
MIKTFLFTLSFLVLLLSSTLKVSAQAAVADKTSFIESDGAQLFVRQVGSGKPLLIVHGGPGLSHDYLAPQLIDLLAGHYLLVFYDQRASGRSTGVEDTTQLTIDRFIADIEFLRKSLALDRIHVVGHSFGGLLAMYYAMAHPDAVEKLILIDSTPASWEPFFPLIKQRHAARQTESERQEIAEIRKAAAVNGHDTVSLHRFYKIYFRPFFSDPRRTEELELGITSQWATNSIITFAHIMKDLGEHDILHTLPRITAPTLLIHGAESVIPVESAEAIARQIPNARLTVLKGIGHFPYIEAPDAFVAAVRGFIR